jgi:transposase
MPPYSPNFNPIEQAFHSMKAWLQRHEAEVLQPETRPWLIQQAMMSITIEDVDGWIKNSGYSFGM